MVSGLFNDEKYKELKEAIESIMKMGLGDYYSGIESIAKLIK